MNDMVEVVIRIPKELYINVLNSWEKIHPKLYKALKNGTVLPKGHGKLIDADELIDSLGASDKDIYCKSVIEEDAPTIIEADTESEET